jgi:hypothetical protein
MVGRETSARIAVAEVPVAPAAPEVEIDPASITEKKPLEARNSPASQGDNMSQEEV